MFLQILTKLKNKTFWAGVATAIGGVLAGTLSAPEAILSLLTSLLGG